jgi:hypothetical protein
MIELHKKGKKVSGIICTHTLFLLNGKAQVRSNKNNIDPRKWGYLLSMVGKALGKKAGNLTHSASYLLFSNEDNFNFLIMT